MADLTLTTYKVQPLHGAVVIERIAGAAGNVGDMVYLDANGYARQADADGVATAVQVAIVVAVGTEGALAFVAGDQLSVVVLGPVTGFYGLTPAALCYLSTTAGALADAAPAGNADVVKVAAIALSATDVFIVPWLPNTQSGIADPSGGATQDAEARTAIGHIIDALELNGLIARTA